MLLNIQNVWTENKNLLPIFFYFISHSRTVNSLPILIRGTEREKDNYKKATYSAKVTDATLKVLGMIWLDCNW